MCFWLFTEIFLMKSGIFETMPMFLVVLAGNSNLFTVLKFCWLFTEKWYRNYQLWKKDTLSKFSTNILSNWMTVEKAYKNCVAETQLSRRNFFTLFQAWFNCIMPFWGVSGWCRTPFWGIEISPKPPKRHNENCSSINFCLVVVLKWSSSGFIVVL